MATNRIITKTKAIVNVSSNINSVTGILKDEITVDELRKNPAKYIGLYPTFYDNADALKHEINTKAKVLQANGKNNSFKAQVVNGITYTPLTRNAKSKRK